MNSASLCSVASRYDNPIPPRFLAPIDFLKFQLGIKIRGRQTRETLAFQLICFKGTVARDCFLASSNLAKVEREDKKFFKGCLIINEIFFAILF